MANTSIVWHACWFVHFCKCNFPRTTNNIIMVGSWLLIVVIYKGYTLHDLIYAYIDCVDIVVYEMGYL